MPAAAICSSCGLRTAARDQVERRVEYRSVVGLRRLRTWRLALICRRCAVDEWEARDHPNGRQGEQAAIPLGDTAGLQGDDATALVLATFPGAELIDPGEEGRLV